MYIDDRTGTLNAQGYKYNYISYQIRIQNSDTIVNKERTTEHTVENKKNILNYFGTVYGIEVPNNIIFVRRNGKTCWC